MDQKSGNIVVPHIVNINVIANITKYDTSHQSGCIFLESLKIEFNII